jgi:S-formylglutathione hydrolase FrmB
VLYLHGVHLASLSDNAAYNRLFTEHGLRVIAPQTGACWWADKLCPDFDTQLTPERYVVDHVLPYIEQRWGAAPPRIALFGTSMGGQGALRMAFKHPRLFPVVAALSPAIDFQIRYRDGDRMLTRMYADAEAARQDTALLHVHPLNWPRNMWFACDPADVRWHESSERLKMNLYSLGIPHDADLETTAGGHGWEYYNHMAPAAIRFIVERLERERLRIV